MKSGTEMINLWIETQADTNSALQNAVWSFRLRFHYVDADCIWPETEGRCSHTAKGSPSEPAVK